MKKQTIGPVVLLLCAFTAMAALCALLCRLAGAFAMLPVLFLSGAAVRCAMKKTLALRVEIGLLEKHLKLAGSQLLLQRERLEALQEDIAETRRSKHDLRHHISLLRELLDADPQRAAAYLNELGASLPGAGDSFCKNLAADCIVRQYAVAAHAEGIAFETAVDLPEEPGVSELDLCIVLGNLLENALEALRGQQSAARIIRVTAGTTGGMMAINVDNSLSCEPRYRRGVLLSGKRDAPGVGLSSVGAVADKYNGEFTWKTVDGMFRASVVLITAERRVRQHENSRV